MCAPLQQWHQTFCHAFTPIGTEGDRSCHSEVRWSVSSDLQAPGVNRHLDEGREGHSGSS